MKRTLILLGLIVHIACPLLGVQYAQEHIAELKQLVRTYNIDIFRQEFNATTLDEKDIARLLSYAQEKREKLRQMVSNLGHHTTHSWSMVQGASMAIACSIISCKIMPAISDNLDYARSWLETIKSKTGWFITFPQDYDYEDTLKTGSAALKAFSMLTAACGGIYGIKKMYQGLHYKVLLERKTLALDEIIEQLEQKNSTHIKE